MAAQGLTIEHMSSASYVPVIFPKNDPDMLKVCSSAFAAAIKAGHSSSPMTMTDIPSPTPEATAMQPYLESILNRTHKHKNAKGIMAYSHKTPLVAVISCQINLPEVGQNVREQMEAADAAVDCLGTATPTGGWPAEIADRWKLYCTCTTCRYPIRKFRFVVCSALYKDTFQMPVKVFATSYLHSGGSTPFLKASVVTEHHMSVSEGGKFVSIYEPSNPTMMVLHQSGLFQPSEDVKAFLDVTNELGSHQESPHPICDGSLSSQPFVYKWDNETQQMDDYSIHSQTEFWVRGAEVTGGILPLDQELAKAAAVAAKKTAKDGQKPSLLKRMFGSS